MKESPNKLYEFNTWFLSLPEGRQKVLVEDKWMLAQAAFEAGLAYKSANPTQSEKEKS